MPGPDRTDVRVFLGSLAAAALLAIPVDRQYDHIEVRELRWWQLPGLVLVLLVAGAATWGESEYGLLSWLRPARRGLRHLGTFLVANAVVVGLYGVSLAFR